MSEPKSELEISINNFISANNNMRLHDDSRYELQATALDKMLRIVATSSSEFDIRGIINCILSATNETRSCGSKLTQPNSLRWVRDYKLLHLLDFILKHRKNSISLALLIPIESILIGILVKKLATRTHFPDEHIALVCGLLVQLINNGVSMYVSTLFQFETLSRIIIPLVASTVEELEQQPKQNICEFVASILIEEDTSQCSRKLLIQNLFDLCAEVILLQAREEINLVNEILFRRLPRECGAIKANQQLLAYIILKLSLEPYLWQMDHMRFNMDNFREMVVNHLKINEFKIMARIYSYFIARAFVIYVEIKHNFRIPKELLPISLSCSLNDILDSNEHIKYAASYYVNSLEFIRKTPPIIELAKLRTVYKSSSSSFHYFQTLRKLLIHCAIDRPKAAIIVGGLEKRVDVVSNQVLDNPTHTKAIYELEELRKLTQLLLTKCHSMLDVDLKNLLCHSLQIINDSRKPSSPEQASVKPESGYRRRAF